MFHFLERRASRISPEFPVKFADPPQRSLKIVVSPVVGPVGAEDEVAFGAGEGDVEEAFFLFEFQVALGVVALELVLGEACDDDGVEFEAFGWVDGEDGDAGVVGGKEVEIAGEGGAVVISRKSLPRRRKGREGTQRLKRK